VGAVTPAPNRMSNAEAVLRKKSPDEEVLRQASQEVSGAMLHWSGVRPSTAYKKPVVEALFVRALRKALGEA
jgi:CO/xanthine dehydrogenase FAD-binding subunit